MRAGRPTWLLRPPRPLAAPLPPPIPQILEDVSEDHAKKTITLDPHPHLALSAASIHPCRHAEVVKKLADNLVEAGREFRVDQ